MNRRITQLSNFVELIENNTISITNVQCKAKACSDIKETDQITPEKFIESLQYLNEAILFRNGIDFYYEFSGRNGVHVESGMKNPYMDQYLYVDCMIQEGVSVEDIDLKLRETTFKE